MYRTYIIKQVSQEIQPSVQLPTVLMPDGKYWTSVDLAIDDGQGGVSIFNDVTVNGYNFGTQYYYTHEAAMRIANNLQGYHLPTREEVTTLMNRIGGESYVISKKLRNTYGWDNDDQGTDDYGFTVLPVGNKFYASDRLEWTGYTTHYWLYDDKPVESVDTRFNNFSIEYNGINNYSDEINAFGYKVRLIKDSGKPIKYRPISIWTPDPQPSYIICPYCNGNGYNTETCDTCWGDSYVFISCDTCDGWGYINRETCPDCNGSGGGSFTCPDCNGSGEYEGNTCGTCEGSGTVDWCPTCNSLGWISSDVCPDCNGNCGHYETCPDCNGEGTINKECDTCHGTGHIEG